MFFMIELYCGDGKGKTTAAAGLAVRAAGHGIPVFFVQFMKDGSSGELAVLQKLPEVSVRYAEQFFGFFRNMNEKQTAEMKKQYQAMFDQVTAEVCRKAAQSAAKISAADQRTPDSVEISCVLILDEVLHACNKGLLDEDSLIAFLDGCPLGVEVLLTGRNPSGEIVKRADYISEVRKERHPFDLGVTARKGIEF